MRAKEVLNKGVAGIKETDYYVPVSIVYAENDDRYKHGERYYYQMLNPKSSFVEVGVNSLTERIVSITLISVNSLEKTVHDIDHLSELEIAGNLVVDMNLFCKEHFVTDNADFTVTRGKKKILVLQNSSEIHKVIKMASVDILLDEDSNIVGFLFMDFTDEEWQELNKGINRSVGRFKKMNIWKTLTLGKSLTKSQ